MEQINILDEVQIRLLFRELAVQNALGQFFDILTERMSEENLRVLTLELRLIDPEIHRKMRRGLLQAMKKKSQKLLWETVTKLTIS